MCSTGRSVESNQKFSTDFWERRHTSPLKKSKKNCGGLAEMFEELRIICHYPTSHRLPVPVCIMCQSQRTGLQNTLLDPLLTRLQSRTFQLPESGQSKPTHKNNNNISILSVICLGFRSALVWLPSTHNTGRDRDPQIWRQCKSSNVQFYDLASAMTSFGTSTLILPYRCGSAC